VPEATVQSRRRYRRCQARSIRVARAAVLLMLTAAPMAAATPAGAADPVIAAAGDIACDPADPSFNGGLGSSGLCRQQWTSNLLVDAQGAPTVSAVLPIGDIQYACPGAAAFAQSYGPSWGRPALKAITYPAAGNHEYYTTANSPTGTGCDATADADGYFTYFGERAGDPAKGYYSYDIGAWHLIALNTNINCAVLACGPGSPQEQWLKADLAANPAHCTLAYFHYPVFSSSAPLPQFGTPFWQALYEAGAEVVLAGHEHHYERFAPQTPAGVADPATGIRELVVGTGGKSLQGFGTIAANSEVRSSTYGVLKLTLRQSGYGWQFVRDPTNGSTFTDSGSGACHGPPGGPDTLAPKLSITTPAGGATVSGVTTISAKAADAGGVGRVDFMVDGTTVGSDATFPYAVPWDATAVTDGQRTISARAIDNAGNQTTASVVVSVDDAGSDIYRVRVDGTRLRRLTDAPARVDYDNPAWSRSGHRIAFGGQACAGCPGAIFVIQPGGGGLWQLPGTVPGAARPNWGPRDRALTFVGGPASSVYTMSSQGTGQRLLTGIRLAHDQSAWSPDGRQIAYTTRQPDGGWDIFVMRANGTAKRNLTRSRASEVQPAWSRDGRRIAFVRQTGGTSTLFVMGARGGPARRLASNCQQPAWSRDGRRIACARLTATGSNIIVMRANGTRQRRLPTGTATAWAPTWSPDGRRIAFASAG